MTDPVGVQVKRLPHGEGLALPAYATDGAAGMDVEGVQCAVDAWAETLGVGDEQPTEQQQQGGAAAPAATV